jgi:hypothetical protein
MDAFRIRFPVWLVVLGMSLAGCADGEGKKEFVPTIARAPEDPLAGGDVAGCPVYLEERCDGGKLMRCEIYDVEDEAFVDQPDPLLRRVFLYDRWYDLFSSPAGLTAERVFLGDMPGSAPESEWTAGENFSGWAGSGDAAIWTGAALVSDVFRYTQTGTEADYQRVEDKVRTLLRNFEVTGIPGYLARYHYLLLPDGGPTGDEPILEYGDPATAGPRDNPIESLDMEGLPGVYTTGVPDGSGGFVQGTPMWHGHPSIDQYTGPMTAFPLVYNLLRDEELKAKIVHHMTCYLKRLRRLEIINLKRNPDIREELTKYFAGTNPKFDPGDPDLMNLSKLVVYYNAGFNRANAGSFDRSCPATVALEPTRVLDAAGENFMVEMLELALDLEDPDEPRPGQIDHFYIANVRGGDASHLMHLAAMAYVFTGDEQYRTFLYDELIKNLQTAEVAKTMMAFRLPDWCFKFYGDHITYQTHWQFITMLGDSELKDDMIQVMEEEALQKALYNHHSAKFNVMYASTVPDGVSQSRDQAIETAVRQLELFGGNDGVVDAVLEAPRRTYSMDRAAVIANLPAGVELRCPTEQERATCEQGGDIFGIPLEQEIISYQCDGRPGECVMQDGMCTEAIASAGLPPDLRRYADFMWQRSPFDIGAAYSIEGQKQSPGRDLSEPYWMARHYGFITEGRGQVLAWREVGNCP